jgi:short-subunit dehydrogenase
MRGEIVLITGGSSGIGFAAAERFARLGAHVWITARDEAKLAAAAEQLGTGASHLAADVTDPDSLARVVEAIRSRHGRLDVLLNSAGQLELGSATDLESNAAERLMRVNYLGLTRVVAATLPLLRLGSRRSIVNLSSFVGRVTPPFWSAYSATKHAVQAYSHALRQELRPEGIHVGLVLPGPVLSPMTEKVLRTPMYPIPPGVPIIGPDPVVEAILRCIRRRKAEVTVPARFGFLLRLGSAFPRLIDLLYLPYRRRVR